jgi:DNA-binding NarL/FixJ family response regulator
VPIRVVIAEDSLLMREGIEKLLAPSEPIQVIDSVGDMPSLFATVERDHPDVGSLTNG